MLLRLHRITHDFLVRVLHGLVWPYHDLSVRLLLAGVFVTSGVLKLTNWPIALELARHEYPVSWAPPIVAAYVGVSVELAGGVLLGLGLLTRCAALALFALTLVIQFAYLPFDHQLYWAALLGWYVVAGAGPLSLDYVLHRGLGDTQPALARIGRGAEWSRTRISPLYLAALRIWLGVAMIVGALAPGWNSPAWLPIHGMQVGVESVTALIGCLLIAGFGTRYVALTLLVVLSISAMMHSQMADEIYGVALLTLVVVDGAGEPSVDAWLERAITSKLRA